MRGKRKQRVFSASMVYLLLCGAFFCAGSLLGIFCEKFVSTQAHEQLSEYLRTYVTFVSEGIVEGSFFAVLLGYLRYPVLTFAAGFFGAGTLLLPIIFAMQGFSLSFAVQCIMASLGQQGALISLSLLGIRSFLILPCTLYLAGTVHRKAEQRRFYITSDYITFGACLCLLLLGAFVDVAIAPKLLQKILL